MVRAVVAGVALSGRGMRVLRLSMGLGAVLIAVVAMGAAPAFAGSTPYSDGATQTPVAVTSWEATGSVAVTLSDEQIHDLATAIGEASQTATVSVPATLTVNPWTTAGLPAGWVQVVVVLGVAIAGWSVGRAFRR